jgi:hypothetical protein
VTIKVLSGSRVIAQGVRDAGWGFAESVTVPVKRVPRTVPNGRICIALGPNPYQVLINGALAQLTAANAPSMPPRFRVEYLHGGHRSWWSLASYVAHRIGLGHAASGTWIVYLEIALMIAVATLAARLILRELR